MKWETSDRENIEDRRGQATGGLGGAGFGGVHLGIGGTVIVLILSLVFHRNLFALFGSGPDTTTTAPSGAPAGPRGSPDEEKLVDFVNAVLKDIQKFWGQEIGNRYQTAVVVLFTNATRSGCGYAESAMGPFYCPADEKVYIDLGFYKELRDRFGAPGDFAQAYVIAHEMGHHIQNLLGIERRVRQAGGPSEGADSNSVKLELQADCFAGIWAHSTNQRQLLDQGDVEEGLGAASAVGDDRLQ